MKHYDIIIIGSGIAGISLGSIISKERKVAIIEKDKQLSYHSTGRSFAFFIESYGNNAIIELTKTEKDISSFGIISGTYEQNEVKRLIINSVGEGAIMVSNYNGNIINGHYITSSALEGLGMKQDSDSLKNYTVAKSTQDEDFTSDYQEITHTDGQTYRYKLIGCTYHCG